MEKETLYTACINYSIYNEQIKAAVQSAIEFGVNWQKKQSYTEEQVISLLDKFGDHIDEWYSNGFNAESETTERWFNNNKNNIK
jgi:hypothetical protein